MGEDGVQVPISGGLNFVSPGLGILKSFEGILEIALRAGILVSIMLYITI